MNDKQLNQLKRRAKRAMSRIPATATRVLDRVQAQQDGKREAVIEFLRKAGRKGGRKSARHPKRRQLNKRAAESRWRKNLPAPKIIDNSA